MEAILTALKNGTGWANRAWTSLIACCSSRSRSSVAGHWGSASCKGCSFQLTLEAEQWALNANRRLQLWQGVWLHTPDVTSASTQTEMLKKEASVRILLFRKHLELAPGAEKSSNLAYISCAQVEDLIRQLIWDLQGAGSSSEGLRTTGSLLGNLPGWGNGEGKDWQN